MKIEKRHSFNQHLKNVLHWEKTKYFYNIFDNSEI